MHFAIVEDLAMDQEHLIRLIQENFKKYNETADFDCYESGEDFLEHFRPGLYHAVFMDIMLNKAGLNGIETSEKLRSIAERIPLIFITSERDYSLQGYRVHPLDYLLKPIDADSLSWCLNEIRTFLAEPAYIEIQASLGQGQTSLKRIFWMIFVCGDPESPPDHPHFKRRYLCAPLVCRASGPASQKRPLLYERPRTSPQFFTGRRLSGGWYHPPENGECIFCSRRKKKETKEAFVAYLFDSLRKGITL